MDWFTVDKEGLAALLERKGKASAVLELVQNAWDAPGVTTVSVTLTPSGRGRAALVVEDDSPDGFADLTHAYTLFAPSAKVHDETKRGRFNLGEKLVLAICDEAEVVSTRGAFLFNHEGRKALRSKRSAGSRFSATIRLTKEEQAEVEALFFQLIRPIGIYTSFNGVGLKHRTPVRSFEINLPTEKANEDGILSKTRRNTVVDLFEPVGDEVPHIYEMGIPVVEYDGKYHADVQQKVPLTFERDNVTPAYLRELYVAIVNEAHDLLTKEDVTEAWVKVAASDKDVSDAAVRDITVKRFGEKTVAYDPNDPQANAEATLKGYTVIHGGMLSGGEWANVKRAGIIRPAGQVTPSNSTMESSPDGIPPLDPAKWTEGMHHVGQYASRLGKELLGVDVRIYVYRMPFGQRAAAWYGHGSLSFNLTVLGHSWFNDPDERKVDALLLHEFAHHRVSNHLSEEFHDEICRLGARLRDVSVRL